MAHIPIHARWYLADLVIEHIIDGDPRNIVHTNMHLVEADCPEQAYHKALAIGSESELIYANTDGKEVRVVFRGLGSLSLIHEALEDGAELAYSEEIAIPEAELKARLCAKEQLSVFAASPAKTGPNFMPASVMRELDDAGFSHDDVRADK